VGEKFVNKVTSLVLQQEDLEGVVGLIYLR